ncbi:MAG: hypothetical protein K5753_03525 [Clostridia bacterium]|nr:hypothetical protein [Clostridia bacterium]
MKKSRVFFSIVWLVCFASLFAFSACGGEWGHMDGTEYLDSSEKEYSLQLKSDFFKDTLEDPDFVVTCKDKDGEVQYVETVKGASSYTLNKDGSEVYAFKNGSHFYVATVNRSQRSYLCSDSSKRGYREDGENGTMADLYNRNYCSFMNKDSGASVADEIPEIGDNFHCRATIEWENNVSRGSLEFTCATEQRTFSMTATADKGFVQTLRVVITDAEGETVSDFTWTFVYGGASVTLPDVDAWDREANA